MLSADDGLSAVAQSSDGKLLGNWTCPNLGTAGTVYGVRVNNDLDLIYLAIADPGCTGPKTCPGHPDVHTTSSWSWLPNAGQRKKLM